MPSARSATKMIAADAQPPRTALRSWRALPSPKAAAKASHRGASRHRVDQNVESCNLFGQIAQMEHMVQPGALRWVPGRAGVPATGHGEAPVQHPKPKPEQQSQPALFAGGGSARAAPPPPRRPRPYALRQPHQMVPTGWVDGWMGLDAPPDAVVMPRPELNRPTGVKIQGVLPFVALGFARRALSKGK